MLRGMNWNTLRIERPAVLTPCIGVCTLGSDGLCEGCLRTGDEIARWSRLSDPERRQLMDEVLPARERERGQR